MIAGIASSNFCTCSFSREICDGRDNDCNGVIDDEPAANQFCVATNGIGASCQDGGCTGGTNLACPAWDAGAIALGAMEIGTVALQSLGPSVFVSGIQVIDDGGGFSLDLDAGQLGVPGSIPPNGSETLGLLFRPAIPGTDVGYLLISTGAGQCVSELSGAGIDHCPAIILDGGCDAGINNCQGVCVNNACRWPTSGACADETKCIPSGTCDGLGGCTAPPLGCFDATSVSLCDGGHQSCTLGDSGVCIANSCVYPIACGPCSAGFTCDGYSGLCKAGSGVPQLSNVWIIVMENTDYSSLTSLNAPYLFGTVIPQGVLMTNYSAVTHPSLPNYIALVGGDRFNITSDGPASSTTYQVPSGTPNIATQLEGAGLTWHEYSESMPTACGLSDVGSDPTAYVSKHNAMPHFIDTQGSPTCALNDVSFDPQGSMPGMAADIAANRFYNYNFISPNLCEDGHDSCAPIGNKQTQQDTFMSNNLQPILNSSAYQNNGVVFVIWSENSQASGGNVYNQVMAVILSPMLSATAKGGSNATAYSHFSLLGTVEAGFGLTSLPAANGHTDPVITDIWK